MRFSIIIVTYNQETTISKTIDSCINQDFNDYEIIICDDCSLDSTGQLVRSFINSKIKYFRHELNLGEYENRTFGIQKSVGEYIIFIDGEDLLYQNALSHINLYLEKFNNIELVISRSWNEKCHFPYKLSNKDFCISEFLGNGATGLNFTNIIFNRKKLIEIGGFQKLNTRLGDHYIQLILGSKYGALYIPEGYAWWRRSPGQASENLVSDFISYKAEQINYIPEVINKLNCLDKTCKTNALNNFYGLILRQVLRNFLKFKYIKEIQILKRIPKRYYFSVFVKSKMYK